MTCNPELVSAFLDGELDTIILNHVTRHLLECEECRKTLSRLAQVRDALTDHYTLSDPEAFTSSIMTAIHNERTVSGSPSRGPLSKNGLSSSVMGALSSLIRPGSK